MGKHSATARTRKSNNRRHATRFTRSCRDTCASLTIHPITDVPYRIDLNPSANSLPGRAWLNEVIHAALRHQLWEHRHRLQCGLRCSHHLALRDHRHNASACLATTPAPTPCTRSQRLCTPRLLRVATRLKHYGRYHFGSCLRLTLAAGASPVPWRAPFTIKCIADSPHIYCASKERGP